MTTRAAATGLALVLGLALALAAGVGAAQADDVDGVVRASDTDSSGAGFKAASASCPGGKSLMGAGFQVSGATNGVVVDDLFPNASVTGVTTDAYGPVGPWTLTTYAICTFFQPGLERVMAQSPGDGGDESATATCPGDKVMVGDGYVNAGGLNGQKVYRLRPNGSTTTPPTAVTVSAAGSATPYAIRAYAICADPSPGLIPGLVRRHTISAATPNNKSVIASCLAGEVMIGTGYEIGGGAGATVVNDLRPNGGTSSAPTSVTVNVYETADLNTNWTVTGYAICAIDGG